jgi:hypothetical protein
MTAPTRSGRAPGATHAVGLVRHDTGEQFRARWTTGQVLEALETLRPRRVTDTNWTVVVGDPPRYLAFSTAGPRQFAAQYPLWRGSRYAGAMTFEALTLADVRRALARFEAGQPLAACLAGHAGTPERVGTRSGRGARCARPAAVSPAPSAATSPPPGPVPGRAGRARRR